MFSIWAAEEVNAGHATDGILFESAKDKDTWWDAVLKALKEPRATTNLGDVEYEREWDLLRVPPKYRDAWIQRLAGMYPDLKVSQYEISGIWIEYPKSIFNVIDDMYKEAFDKYYNCATDADAYKACLNIDETIEKLSEIQRLHPDANIHKITTFIFRNLTSFKSELVKKTKKTKEN